MRKDSLQVSTFIWPGGRSPGQQSSRSVQLGRREGTAEVPQAWRTPGWEWQPGVTPCGTVTPTPLLWPLTPKVQHPAHWQRRVRALQKWGDKQGWAHQVKPIILLNTTVMCAQNRFYVTDKSKGLLCLQAAWRGLTGCIALGMGSFFFSLTFIF